MQVISGTSPRILGARRVGEKLARNHILPSSSAEEWTLVRSAAGKFDLHGHELCRDRRNVHPSAEDWL
jgi:hypothetical protein